MKAEQLLATYPNLVYDGNLTMASMETGHFNGKPRDYKTLSRKEKFKTVEDLRKQLRNLLLEMRFLTLDKRKNQYLICEDYFQHYMDYISSNKISLNRLLRIIEDQKKIGKQAEVEVVKFKKKRLQSYPSLVDKIEQTKYVDEFIIKHCSVNGVWVEVTPALKHSFNYFRRIQVDNTKLESTYKIIVEFIKWYNKQEK